jgi:hypothetical protein
MIPPPPASSPSPAAAPHPTPPRHPWRPALAAALTIALGLASRLDGVRDVIGKYPGDALWALLVVLLLATAFPRARANTLITAALAIAFTVELLKCIPALAPLRDNPYGALVFGHAFSWQNLVAYIVGVLLGAILDRALMPPPSPSTPPQEAT